jgi:hypothetical protein
MPWKSGEEFAKKHNKKLSGHSAEVAKAAAESALQQGKSEGSAIAIGNAAGNKAKGKGSRK